MTLIDPDEYKNAPENDSTYAAIKLKTPKRILHFSDGILEEYSDDDESDNPPPQTRELVDPATLSWGPWTWYKLWSMGNSTVSYLDAAGEFMAAALGITTPKYYFELEEYKRKKNESNADKLQRKGWSEPSGVRENQGIEFTEIRTTQPVTPMIV